MEHKKKLNQLIWWRRECKNECE